MNKNFTLTLLIAAALIGFSMSANAQTTQITADGTSTATVISPLTLTPGNDLAFGDITEYGAGGTITVAPAASTTAVAANGAQAMGGTVTAGSFTVTGQNATAYTINLPLDGTVTLTGATGSPMPVNNFQSDIPGGTIGTNDSFYVGATLEVGAGQTAEDYTGTYTVTVQYN